MSNMERIMSASVEVDLQVASNSLDIPTLADIQTWIITAIGNNKNNVEICVRIVDIKEGAELNQQWRNKNGPTNVLSFPSELPSELKLPLLGDIVICAPVVKQESQQLKKEIKAHWAHMIVHGTLHLLGYEHIEDWQAEVMESMETEILKSLGFANPY